MAKTKVGRILVWHHLAYEPCKPAKNAHSVVHNHVTGPVLS